MKRNVIILVVIAIIVLSLLVVIYIDTPEDIQEPEFSDEPPGYRYNGLIFTLEVNMTTNASAIKQFYLDQGFSNVTFSIQHSYYDDRDATIGVIEDYPPYAQSSIVMKHEQWAYTDNLDVMLNESVRVTEVVISLQNNGTHPYRYYSNYTNAYNNNSWDTSGFCLFDYDCSYFDYTFDKFCDDFYSNFDVIYIDSDIDSWIIYQES